MADEDGQEHDRRAPDGGQPGTQPGGNGAGPGRRSRTDGMERRRGPAARVAWQLLVSLDRLAGAARTRAIRALRREQAAQLTTDVDDVDRAQFRALLAEIANERAANTAEHMSGQLSWSGSSESDPAAGFQIDDTRERPRVDTAAQTTRPTEATVNHFARWMRGGPPPTSGGGMNCWEAILFAGWRAGVLPLAWLRQVHEHAALSGALADLDHDIDSPQAIAAGTRAYDAAIQGMFGAGDGQSILGRFYQPAPLPRGNLVFFNGLEHVALSLGTVVTVAGQPEHEIMSLWGYPLRDADHFNYHFQRTTVERLSTERLLDFVTMRPAPWAR